MTKLRLFILILVVAAVGIMGLIAGVVGARMFFPSSSVRAYNSSLLLKQIQAVNQLVTVKYVLEKVVVLEDVKWYGQSRVLMLAHGVVKAGVDLRQVRAGDVSVSGGKISIHLPRPVITDVYLDERKTQIIERSTGLLMAFDKDLEQNARRMAVDEMKTAARSNDILSDAQERAMLQVKTLCGQLGFSDVEVTVGR
jgi:hypothetical protein